MIHTITPNPALDICCLVDRLVPDEKNYVHHVSRFPGGNGINVARVLTRLESACRATGFLGGATGKEIQETLTQERVQHDFVKIHDTTRSSVTVSQLRSHCQTRLSFPGPVISASEAQKLELKLSGVKSRDWVVFGGSLPNAYSPKMALRLFDVLRRKEVPYVIDCPASVLRKLIRARPLLIKPNLGEFQDVLGRRIKSLRAVVSAAYPLTRYVSLVCVSSVDGGAVLVTRKGAWFGKGKVVKARSTVGAGDSMVAGMVSRLCTTRAASQINEELACETLRFGIAAGMATAVRRTGELGDSSDIRHFLSKVSVKKLDMDF